MSSSSCILCTSTQYRESHTIDGYTIVHCTECGLVFVDPTPSSLNIRRFYETFDYKSAYSQGEDIIGPQVQSLDFVEGLISGKGNVLDIGCATGRFLSFAAQRGWGVLGVESSSKLARYARDNHGLPVTVGFFENIEFDRRFDLVTMFQLIEHVRNPRLVIRKSHEIIKKGGFLILQTPNIESLEAKIFRRDYNMLTPPGHLYYFSPRTLSRLVESEGFRIVRRRTLPATGLLRATLTYWFFSGGRWREQIEASGKMDVVEVSTSSYSPPYKRVIRSGLDLTDLPLAKTLGHIGLGPMIEVVCKKQ